MDQIKIGKFIAARRKAKEWTQVQLAEKLGITDKAVSKWETGKSMPDLSLFTPLCNVLEIALNELLLGEYISEENLKEKSNALLMDVITNWLGQDRWKTKGNTDSPGSILVLQNVHKVYKTEFTSTIAVNNVSFQIPHSSFVGIMGASGSGKTTLLNLIATIDKPTSALDSHSVFTFQLRNALSSGKIVTFLLSSAFSSTLAKPFNSLSARKTSASGIVCMGN